MQISMELPFFSENLFWPLEKLLVGLQGSGRACWKDLLKNTTYCVVPMKFTIIGVILLQYVQIRYSVISFKTGLCVN